MKKKNQIRYSAWNEHLNNTRERTNYSIRRMDLLIISISGAGIYIIFETLREFKAGRVEFDYSGILLISGLCFLVAIISNFISQKTGYYSNDYEEKFICIELNKIRGKDIDACKQDEYDRKVKKYNRITNSLNIASIILMFFGLILLALFNFNLF
ncbi:MULTISPECIES: hypothetical protein [Bizionia]|uniref:Uncharacterized protein n=1 Tax=Bizionia algoritergicola TaxID=291187 RepID=A0A5D0QMQ8_9FLAO|nr:MULTISPECIES: hypothetical protein [Bizionia]OBX17734.1 hypothetical protein BAA08_15835 [Bizionia sp. APA-3]TYB69484.1 hypothetical protein ES675_16140 [Bizionia algoritergicola]